MKARNDKGETRGQRNDTIGMLINQALTPEMRAHIRAGLPKLPLVKSRKRNDA